MDAYVAALEALLPAGWSAESDAVLVCPCGIAVEVDGECPNGCESPIRALGLI